MHEILCTQYTKQKIKHTQKVSVALAEEQKVKNLIYARHNVGAYLKCSYSQK